MQPCHHSHPANRAANYLSQQILGSGMFIYERDASRPEWSSSSYNLLRHAGSVYALLQHHRWSQRNTLSGGITLAGLKLLDWLRPLPDHPETLVAWSIPGVNDTVSNEQAKLGGSALTLLALTELDSIAPETIEADVLTRLARGIMTFQRDDGFFFSKSIAGEQGFDKTWNSLFYPGEAALALLRLARHRGSTGEPWSKAAQRGLLHLSNSRQDTPSEAIPLDHWALIATAEFIDQQKRPSSTDSDLLEHASKIVEAMLARQIRDYSIPSLHGSFATNGSTTTTATCLEGLLAIQTAFQSDLYLFDAIEQACQQGMNYLLRAQLSDGIWLGATPSLAEPNHARIRIDYVQHALCAFVGMASRDPAQPIEAETKPFTSAGSTISTGILTQPICNEALNLGLRFMLSKVQTDGRISYEVPLRPGPAESSTHQVREAGGVWGLSLYLHRPGLSDRQRRAIWAALARCHERLQRKSRSRHGRRWPLADGESSGLLGTAALHGLALVEMLSQADCPERQQRYALLKSLLTFILTCRQSSGRYHSGYNLTTGEPTDEPSPYFDGEVCLLLAKAARVLGMTEYAVPATTAADSMFAAYAETALRDEQLSDDCKGFYQWGSMAMRELHQLEPNERRWSQRVLAMADWILDVHQVLSRKRNTGYAFEGLISAFHLAELQGKAGTQERLRRAIEEGLSRLCTWQLGSSLQCQALQMLTPHNPQAVGGVLGGRNDNVIRIDTVQHQMHALLLAERHLAL